VARRTRPRLAGRDPLRRVGPVGPVTQDLRGQPRPRDSGRRSIPSRQARQLEAGRVPAAGAERDRRSPGPQGRPAVSGATVVDQGARTARRARRDEAARVARRRRSPR
jgi:hypothetical protein